MLRKEIQEKLESVRWGSLEEETKEQLLQIAECWENKVGLCTVDFGDNLAITGELVENEEEITLQIDDEAIFYNPQGDINSYLKFFELYNGKKADFTVNAVFTVSEAARKLNITEAAIRYHLKKGILIEGIDYRKAGGTTLITLEALRYLYKENNEIR